MRKKILMVLSFIAICCTACNSDTITVTYNGDNVSVSPREFEDVEITVKNSKVNIVNNVNDRKITFVLKGESQDGTFKLKTDNKAKIEFNNLKLTSNEGAPVVIKNKKEVQLIAADGTENTLTVTACEDTAKHKASTIHAKKKVKFGGHGTLNVIATGKGCKGINIKDDITIEDLTLNVTTSGMYLAEDTTNHFGPGPGFDPNNMPEEMKAQFEEMRKKFEEMQKNGQMPQFPGMPGGGPMGPPQGMPNGDGAPQMGGGMPPMGMGGPMGGSGMPPMKGNYIGKTKAIKSTGKVIINSGNITVNTSTPGAEGIEGKDGVIINGGTVYIKAADDAINANAQIFFNGGNITAISTNNDAVDANLEGGFPPFFQQDNNKQKDQKSAIIITGGTVFAWSQAGSPEEGLDCDFCPIDVTGGTVFSIGGGMGEMPSVPTVKTAKQPTTLVLGLTIKEGQKVEIFEADDNGNAKGEALESFTPAISFNGSASLISSPSFKVGKKYVVKSASTTRVINLEEQFTICRQ